MALGRRGSIVLLLALAGCQREAGNPAPPRETGPAVFPQQVSTIVIPLAASSGSSASPSRRETHANIAARSSRSPAATDRT